MRFRLIFQTSWIFLLTSASANPESPVLQPLIIPSTLNIGDSLNVFCAIIRGSLPVLFKWYKDGEELSSNSNMKISIMDGTSLLKTSQINIEDIANYTCSVSNQAGSDASTSALAIKVPPQWKLMPTNQTAPVGTILKIDCKVDGFPRPRITWRDTRDSSYMPIPNDSRNRKYVSSNGTLVISPMQISDSGEYVCEARNGLGSGLSQKIKIEVHIPPQLRPTVDVTAQKGGLAQLLCKFNGNGTITINWFEKDSITPVLKDSRFESTQRQVEDGYEGELLIRGVAKEDESTYLCQGLSLYGKDTGSVKLQVVESAATPRSVRVLDTDTRSTRVAWRRSSTKDDLLKRFIVRYWQRGGHKKQLHDLTLPASETSASIKDLDPGTSYVVQILAENDVGMSEPTDAFEFRTLEEAPTVPPTDFQVDEIGSNYLVLSWKPPPKEHWNGELQGFYLGYKIKDSSAPYTFKRISLSEDDFTGKETFRLSGLQKSNVYSVVVKAFNAVGAGPETTEIEVTLLIKDPPFPPSLTLSDVDPTTAVITWESHTEHTADELQHYELQVRSMRNNKQWRTYHIPGKVSFFTLHNLESATRFEARIAGVSEVGRGRFSPCLYFTTSSDIHAFERDLMNDPEPFYLRPYVIIPVAASLVVVLTSLLMAWVCYKKTIVKPFKLQYCMREPLRSQPLLLHRDHRMSNVSDNFPPSVNFNRPEVNSFDRWDSRPKGLVRTELSKRSC